MQERIRTSQTYVEHMTEAMKSLPRLKNASMVPNKSENHYARERAASGAGLYSLSDGCGSLDYFYGVWQALCLLMGALPGWCAT